MPRFAPEGYPFFAFFAALTAVVFYTLGSWAAIIPFVLFLFMLYFFRDPERTADGPDGFICPADGKVIVVKEVFEPDYIKDSCLQISIFMSPLNVHVNRAPCDGDVESVKFTPGKYLPAFKEDAPVKNQNTVMVLNGKQGRVMLRQVSGAVARRTVNRMKSGDKLLRGERFGIIKFSSRVDSYFPKGAKSLVKLGDRVFAGQTIIATEGGGN